MGLRIAMLGTRGVPATFGGIEHHVEEIGSRLAQRGHEVTVYAQRGYVSEVLDPGAEEYRGMRVVQLDPLPGRGVEAFTHAAAATAVALRERQEVLHYHAVGPGLFTPFARAAWDTVIVQTIHGLDADRAKWGWAPRQALRLGTWLSARVPHRTITVSQALDDEYRVRYGRTCVAIPNGINTRPHREPKLITEKHGLHGGDYLLFVGRLVPEKRPDLLIETFARVTDDELKLVVVGGSGDTDEYVDQLHTMAARDRRVIMPGYTYGPELDEMFSNARLFVQPSDLEGLPLTLLEAVGAGCNVVASDIPPHLEIVPEDQPGGRLFAHGDTDAMFDAITRGLADRSVDSDLPDTIRATYTWTNCVDALEEVYYESAAIATRGRRGRPAGIDSVPVGSASVSSAAVGSAAVSAAWPPPSPSA
ncbi:glycosyltransferase family 4 protein [Skermania piniformis]|uniref:Glycosyltransferase family 4 protein n=1 Tax=Skermania pinensis TaxID=39122 RepID=A0ABX8S8E5_9ACTN|nr:glycosyltransferase family 4 protein [Skermania piniformis]QXQ14138.1 glycosyltransferase family 4 protein [Skermania piniformis]